VQIITAMLSEVLVWGRAARVWLWNSGTENVALAMLPWECETCVWPTTTTRPFSAAAVELHSLPVWRGTYTVQAVLAHAPLTHQQRGILHNWPTAACLHSWTWYSPAFSHTVRPAGTEDAPDVRRARLQCSCSRGVEQPTVAHPHSREHWHF